MGNYRWRVIAPDGRVLFDDVGGRDVEARAYGTADRFNVQLPWHDRNYARVEMTPTTINMPGRTAGLPRR